MKAIDKKTLFVSLASSLSTINDFVESEGVKNIIFTHPISGSHKSGYENASPNLFNQKNVISVNVNDLQENLSHEIEKIWSSIGSNIEVFLSNGDVLTINNKELTNITNLDIGKIEEISFEKQNIIVYAKNKKTLIF